MEKRCQKKRKRWRDLSLKERFWRRVKKSNGCWLWIGGKTGINGYGRLRVDGRKESAHRISWLFHRGKIPKGELVLHKCDVRPCVNPDHLFLGSYSDNVIDCVGKGRPFGYGAKKLTNHEVEEIRKRYRPWDRQNSLRALGKEFGVKCQTIHAIVLGETWKESSHGK